MTDASSPRHEAHALQPGVPNAPAQRLADPKPVLLVLHQRHSVPGHIGRTLALQGHRLDIRRPRFGDPLPETLAEHDGAVIFGGPMSANDPDDYIKRETDWIGVPLAENAPFLGVCLGGQMLSNHLGGAVAPDPGGYVEIGYHPITPEREVFDEGAWPEMVYQWHSEGFTLPTGAERVARGGEAFTNQAYRYGDTALSIQFHPEITYWMVARWSGYNLDKLNRPGAQPRAEQMSDHIVYSRAVHGWLDRLLAAWVRAGRRARAADGISEAAE